MGVTRIRAESFKEKRKMVYSPKICVVTSEMTKRKLKTFADVLVRARVPQRGMTERAMTVALRVLRMPMNQVVVLPAVLLIKYICNNGGKDITKQKGKLLKRAFKSLLSCEGNDSK